MRLEHHLVGGYMRYISPHIIIIKYSFIFLLIISYFLIQLGTLIGCVLDFKASVAGITIIALGTSVPDTFASRTAAIHDQYADAAIGNITGMSYQVKKQASPPPPFIFWSWETFQIRMDIFMNG